MQKATKLICISKSIQDYYSNFVCPDGNYVQIYNGVGISNSIDNQIYLSKIINFCCIGLLFHVKGQFEIVQGAKILLEEYGDSDFRIHFTGGEDKAYGDKIRNFVHENGLGEYVKFWGHQSEISSILPKMVVGIMASKKEAFGRVTVEYMLVHMPVIGSNAGGTVGIIDDGATGTFFNQNDIYDLAAKMHEYIID